MRLSKAIRLGAMLKPQGFIGDTDRGEPGERIKGDRTCALEAALEAIGGKHCSYSYHWPWINRRKTRACVVCGMYNLTPMIEIMHLNDHHKWTRERIADWVETIERAQEPHVFSAWHGMDVDGGSRSRAHVRSDERTMRRRGRTRGLFLPHRRPSLCDGWHRLAGSARRSRYQARPASCVLLTGA